MLRTETRVLLGGLCALLGATSACSPSSSGVGAAGLRITDSIAVVQTTSAAGGASVQSVADFPPDSEFFTDPVSDRVFDESQKVLDTLNEILCFISQTSYADLVNEGAYTAQIDPGVCATGRETPGFELWTCECRRPDPDGPQIVRIWAPGGDPGDPDTLFINMQVLRARSETQPFGVFSLNFARAVTPAGLTNPDTCGNLRCFSQDDGRVGFTFYDLRGQLDELPEPGDEQCILQLEVQVDPDFSAGAARVLRRYRRNDGGMDSGIQQEEFLLAFDQDHLVRQRDDGPVECLSKTDYQLCNVRYNLYHAEGPEVGQRVRRSSGFPIVHEDGRRGYATDEGLWLDDGQPLMPGDVVFRDRPDGPGERFTVAEAPGRLIEVRRNVAPLANYLGSVFITEDPSGGARPGAPLVELTVLDDMGPKFFITSILDDRSGEWVDIDPPIPVELFPFQRLAMFAPLLGIEAEYVEDGAVQLATFERRVASTLPSLFVNGPRPELFGFFDVIRRDLNGTEAADGDVYYPPFEWIRHEFRRNSLTLFVDDSEQGTGISGLAPGQSYEGGVFPDGFRSGPLVRRAVRDSILNDPPLLYTLPVHFQWETGQPQRNLQVLIREDSSEVVFEPPLHIPYRHSTEQDSNEDPSFDGVQVPLQYGGSGQLLGIPWVDKDIDGDEEIDGTFPAFSIADGTEVVDSDGKRYVVKAIERERVLNPATSEPDLDLEQAGAMEIPDGSSYRTPAIGPEPQIEAPPTVVAGEVQD